MIGNRRPGALRATTAICFVARRLVEPTVVQPRVWSVRATGHAALLCTILKHRRRLARALPTRHRECGAARRDNGGDHSARPIVSALPSRQDAMVHTYMRVSR